MKLTELDSMINEVLAKEAKKLIQEQVSDMSSVSAEGDVNIGTELKHFKTLTQMGDAVRKTEPLEGDDFGVVVFVETTVKQMQSWFGEHPLRNLTTYLMHDLEQDGIKKHFDVDVEIVNQQGDNVSFKIEIRSTDEVLGEDDIPDTNPNVEDKKDVILGGNKINENTDKKMNKKTITLNEAEMADFLKKILSEASDPMMDPKTQSVLHQSGKQNNDALKAVEKKIKDYLSFKGNDNPEFPNQIGMGDDKEARVATSDEEEEIEDNRGRGPQDLDYQNEPSDKFKERLKMSLVGASEMGNPSDAANAIKTDVGKDMHKNIEKRQKIHRKEPIYAKEPVPVATKPKEDEMRPIHEEMDRMKRMASYDAKTQ